MSSCAVPVRWEVQGGSRVRGNRVATVDRVAMVPEMPMAVVMEETEATAEPAAEAEAVLEGTAGRSGASFPMCLESALWCQEVSQVLAVLVAGWPVSIR